MEFKKMAETLGVAIVGAGMMGAVHSRASQLAGATLKGIAASSPQSAKAAAAHLAHLGMERAYSNADEAIPDPAGGVIHICTPNSTHYPIAMSALAAAKHVVCEKPLATSLSDARALAAA